MKLHRIELRIAVDAEAYRPGEECTGHLKYTLNVPQDNEREH
jgi:hypothetical protein